VPGVALRERDGLGNPIPLDALGLRHTYHVADSGERPVRGAAALLVKQRTTICGKAICYLPEQIPVGLSDSLRHRESSVGKNLEKCVLVEG